MAVYVKRDEFEGIDLNEKIEEMPLYALERAMGESSDLPSPRPRFRTAFRLYDDDRELMYSGELDDDDECVNQTAALRWGESNAGCTIIEVRRGPKWVQEIA